MPAKRKDFSVAVNFYESGYSVAKIAAHFGISRQAMYTILKRRNVVFREKPTGANNHFYIHGNGYARHKSYAVVKLNKALRTEKITRQACELCGFSGKAKDGRSLVQGHHEDYAKPLDVRWLCQTCHFHEHHR